MKKGPDQGQPRASPQANQAMEQIIRKKGTDPNVG